MSGLPPIPGFPQLPQIGNFLPLPQGAASPFSNQQQNQLIAIANGIPNFNPSVLTSGSTDLYNTEQYLIQNNQSLLSTIQSIASLTSNPEEFISQFAAKGLVDASAIGFPSAIYSALGSPNNFPHAPIQSPLTTLQPRSSGVSIVSGLSSTSTAGQVSSVVPAQTFSLPTALRPFINALAGQTGQNNQDFWSILNGLYNFALNSLNNVSSVNLSLVNNIIAGFNVGNLLGTGGVNSATVPYFFPLQNGDSFTQFIQSLLTWSFNPGAVAAQILLTTPSASSPVSLSGNAWNFLSQQNTALSGDPTGQPFAQYTRPFVNVLFGVNPSTISASDPFDILYSLIASPSSFITSLFSTTDFSGTTVTPQKLVGDLLSGNTSQFQSDLLSVFTTPFPNFFVGLIPSLSTAQGSFPNSGILTSAQQLFTDIFNGNFGSVPCDLLGMVSISSYAGLPQNPVSQATSLCQMISQLFNNITQLSANLFIGQHPNTNFIGFNDSIQYGNIPVGEGAGSSSVAGWGSSVLPSGGPIGTAGSNLNGFLQGDLGAAIMLALAAVGDFQNAISNTKSSASNFFNINFVSSASSAGTALKQSLSGGYFLANAVSILATIVSQLVASLNNIKNVLNNAGIPTGIGNNGSNFSMTNIAGILG